MLRRGKRLRAAGHIIYRDNRSLSAPLRPSAPRVRGLRAPPPRPRWPCGAKSAPRPCTLRPRPMRKARGFSLFLSTFPRKTHLSQKRSRVSLPASPTGSPPRPRRRGKISHRRGECAQKCARVHFFFYFCLLSTRGKHAIFASKTCFINSAWQNLGASSPFFVSPPECPDTFLPSL